MIESCSLEKVNKEKNFSRFLRYKKEKKKIQLSIDSPHSKANQSVRLATEIRYFIASGIYINVLTTTRYLRKASDKRDKNKQTKKPNLQKKKKKKTQRYC